MSRQLGANNPSLMTAGVLILLACASGWWRMMIAHTNGPIVVKSQPWEHVKEDYPLPPEPIVSSSASSTARAQEVIQANPFSPERHAPPPTDTPGAIDHGPDVAAAPRFVYKGHLNLGNRRRAIVEETTLHKTYFLEVGQEVAGFKVLDITETQVVVSDLQTHEEVVIHVSAKTGP